MKIAALNYLAFFISIVAVGQCFQYFINLSKMGLLFSEVKGVFPVLTLDIP